MPDVSPILALPFLMPAQAQKHVTHNEALARLDVLVQLVVDGFGATTPPALPVEGAVHALGAAPLADWAGHADALAVWLNGAWVFIAPQTGWRAWGKAEQALRVWSGGAWRAAAPTDNLASLGIATTADSTNRLAVAAPAVLFSHAGAGHQVKVNKAAPADTAALLFQSGWSGRAEIGLAGDDDLRLKVSADGTGFVTALRVARVTGRVHLPAGLALGGLSADPAAPEEGLVWHNATTGQLRAQIGGVARVLAAQDVPWLTPVAGDYVQTTTGAGGGTPTTLAGAAGRVDLFPFIPRGDIGVDRLAVNVTTGVAGAQGKLVIYSADALGRPDALLVESGVLDFAGAGVREATVSLTLRRGVTFWCGVRHSSTATLSAWPLTATPDLNGGGAPSILARKILRRTLTFTTAAPAAWGYVAAETVQPTATAIWMRAL